MIHYIRVRDVKGIKKRIWSKRLYVKNKQI